MDTTDPVALTQALVRCPTVTPDAGPALDALIGGWTRERRLELLDDPRHGSYGVAALCGSIVLRIVAVAALAPGAAFTVVLPAHATV